MVAHVLMIWLFLNVLLKHFALVPLEAHQFALEFLVVYRLADLFHRGHDFVLRFDEHDFGLFGFRGQQQIFVGELVREVIFVHDFFAVQLTADMLFDFR